MYIDVRKGRNDGKDGKPFVVIVIDGALELNRHYTTGDEQSINEIRSWLEGYMEGFAFNATEEMEDKIWNVLSINEFCDTLMVPTYPIGFWFPSDGKGGLSVLEISDEMLVYDKPEIHWNPENEELFCQITITPDSVSFRVNGPIDSETPKSNLAPALEINMVWGDISPELRAKLTEAAIAVSIAASE